MVVHCYRPCYSLKVEDTLFRVCFYLNTSLVNLLIPSMNPILGDTKELSGHSPRQPAPVGQDDLLSSPFQPQQFCDEVVPSLEANSTII